MEDKSISYWQQAKARYNRVANAKNSRRVRVISGAAKYALGPICGRALSMVISLFYYAYKLMGRRIFGDEKAFNLLTRFGEIVGLAEVIVFIASARVFFDIEPILPITSLPIYAVVYAVTMVLGITGVTLFSLKMTATDFSDLRKSLRKSK